MVKRLIAELISSGILKGDPNEDILIYKKESIPTECTPDGITLDIISNDTYDGNLLLEYDGCVTILKSWVIPSEEYQGYYGNANILLPPDIDPNNMLLRRWIRISTYNITSDTKSTDPNTAGTYATIHKLSNTSGQGAFVYLEVYGSITGENCAFISIDFDAAEYQYFIPPNIEEDLYFLLEIGISVDTLKGYVSLKNQNGVVLYQWEGNINTQWANSPISHNLRSSITEMSVLNGYPEALCKANATIIDGEVEPYYG